MSRSAPFAETLESQEMTPRKLPTTNCKHGVPDPRLAYRSHRGDAASKRTASSANSKGQVARLSCRRLPD